ncbi:MAG TPA: hypothetical protein VLT84_09470 [Acidobacteriota bacterium]|nr:hypothetical protein [Acidobacteriota bacterium]
MRARAERPLSWAPSLLASVCFALAAGPVTAHAAGAPAARPSGDFIAIVLVGGEELDVVRVERANQDNLLAILASGKRRFVQIQKVVSIRDETGLERIDDVIRRYTKLDLGLAMDPERRRRSSVLRGFPLPERTRYVVMELGYLHPTSTAKPGTNLMGYGVWQVAYLTNWNEQFALGPALQVEAGGDEVRFDALARGRRWLSPDASVELSLGASLGTNRDGSHSVKSTSPALVLQGAVNVRDLILLTAQAESFSRDLPEIADPFGGDPAPARTERGTTISLGVRGGGELGVLGTGVLVLVGATFVIWIAALANSSS